MNTARHSRYAPPLDRPPLADYSGSATAALARLSGLDTARALKTFDGDRVRLLCVDAGHQFPLVGEVVDYHAQTSWLARWTVGGIYASSSPEARAKHSIQPNLAACPPPSVYTDRPVIIPRFLLKEPASNDEGLPEPRQPTPAELLSEFSDRQIARARCAIADVMANPCVGAPVDLAPGLRKLRAIFAEGLMSSDALLFSEAVLYVINRDLKVNGDVDRLTPAHLRCALELLESGRAGVLTINLPGSRKPEAACA